MEQIADPALAESWDNVGLIVGDEARRLEGPVLVTIDYGPAVLAEALEMGAGAIVSYHPPLFRPTKRLTASAAIPSALLGAIEAGMAVYSPHTALDAAANGLTDWLCGALAPIGEDPTSSFGDVKALQPHASDTDGGGFKIVTFVPGEHAERVRDALASIGAGRIGLYERCSFHSAGTGSFQGGAGTSPATGSPGQQESVAEVRLEMVCPAGALGLAKEMIEQFHPYEEPAWDIYPLAAKPNRNVGAGRRLTLDRPARPSELAERVKERLGLPVVKTALVNDEPVSQVGVCAGSGGSLADAAIREGCSLFFTGEMSHHEGLDAVYRGCGVLLAGHTNTERGYMPTLASRISDALGGHAAVASKNDRGLFRSV